MAGQALGLADHQRRPMTQVERRNLYMLKFQFRLTHRELARIFKVPLGSLPRVLSTPEAHDYEVNNPGGYGPVLGELGQL